MSSLRIILMGPPGAGKGTQAERLQKDYSACYIATGDMLRAAVAAGTELGKVAAPIMARGEFVPDSLMVGMLRETLSSAECSKGFIIDGFPRSVPQAEILDAMLHEQKKELQAVIKLDIPDDLLVRRVTGRLVHKASGRTYHTEFQPPKVAGKDDVTGEPLIKRADDNEETLRKRLREYHTKTVDACNHYNKKGLLRVINADQKPDVVYAQMQTILRASK